MVCFHTIMKKDAKFKRFQFVCKQICNRISLRADVPPEKASRHAGYNRIEVFAHVRSRKRTRIRVMCSFPVELLPSWEGVWVWALNRQSHMMTSYSGTLCSAPLQNLAASLPQFAPNPGPCIKPHKIMELMLSSCFS